MADGEKIPSEKTDHGHDEDLFESATADPLSTDSFEEMKPSGETEHEKPKVDEEEDDLFQDVDIDLNPETAPSLPAGSLKMMTEDFLRREESPVSQTPPLLESGEPVVGKEEPSPEPESPPAQLPLSQPSPVFPSPTVRSKVEEELEDSKDPECTFEISISEFEKKGDGMNAFVRYKVVCKVGNAPGFNASEYTVWRRFSDFLGLHQKLVEKHQHNGRMVPPPPEKSVVGMTKTKLAKEVEEDTGASEFLEKRRAALERFLGRLARHPTLLQDPDVRDFVTVEGDLPKSTQTSALSGAGVRRAIGALGNALGKMAFRMDETDRWFEEKQTEVEEMDESLKKLQASVEYLVHFRRELATSVDGFCKGMSLLAACEENTALSRSFSQLAETQEKVGLIHADQAEKDFFILSETLRDYIALMGTVKEVFYERVKAWNNWQSAQQNLSKKRELKTRLELAGKTDKLPSAKKDVQDAEQKVQECEEEFQRISKMIRKEMRRFDAHRVLDFKRTLLHYLESLALTQQQLVKYWEAFLPEAKAIIT